MKKVILQPIKLIDIINCFKWTRQYKYHYLGVHWNIFHRDSNNYLLYEAFIKYIDSQTKPWWCPRFILNLLHLFGDDNSIVRMRNFKLSNLKRYLTNGIHITDCKIKYGTLRVYGGFTQDIEEALTELESLINPTLEAY